MLVGDSKNLYSIFFQNGMVITIADVIIMSCTRVPAGCLSQEHARAHTHTGHPSQEQVRARPRRKLRRVRPRPCRPFRVVIRPFRPSRPSESLEIRVRPSGCPVRVAVSESLSESFKLPGGGSESGVWVASLLGAWSPFSRAKLPGFAAVCNRAVTRPDCAGSRRD